MTGISSAVATRPPRGVLAKAGRGDLRKRNKRLLLHLIQTAGPCSQADLARRSGLSPASVSTILQPLIERQLLIEEGKTSAGIGRRASMLAFNPRAALTVALVIEPEGCEVALVDMSARVVDYAAVSYPQYTEPHEVVAAAAAHVASFVERNGIDRHALIAAGVAMPGSIDAKTGVVKVAANLGWRDVQLRSLVERNLQLPARIEHLGRAKLRAEAIWGRGVGHENFICLEIGSGIGAGVMVDGHTLRGATAAAGEVGHQMLDPRGPVCACGLTGCWEAFCASPAIRRRLAMHLASDAGSGTSLTPASSLAELGRAASAGDPVARRVVDETAEYLARGLVNLIWSFDPELIILSGRVVQDCPCLVEATQAAVRAYNAVRTLDIPLVPSINEAPAGVVAASAIVSVRYLDKLANE